jgi:alpha-ketoglutarate-dependent taurine dioxygenase
MTQIRRLGGSRPKAVRLEQDALFAESRLEGLSHAPVVLTPSSGPLDPVAATAASRDAIRAHLLRAGAVLLRGCRVTSASHFEAIVGRLAGETIHYGERSSPRSLVAGHVYTSTDYPADQAIPLHNENSYAHQWPMTIAFYCETPAHEGGETPIADVRAVYARLSPSTRRAFSERQVRYTRNYGEGLGLSWTDVFGTSHRHEVEAFCCHAGYDVEWRDGNRLRTRRRAPAIRPHPVTGEPLWFNHALFFHPSSLPAPVREALRVQMDEEEWPHHTALGDGTPIPRAMLAEIRAAYEAETLRFRWEQGDVLILDNMLMAHARSPYTGLRRVLVCMAEPRMDDGRGC